VFAGNVAEKILRRLDEVHKLYNRLLVVVSPTTGDLDSVRAVAKATGAPIVNVNLELSRQLLELNNRQRALQAHGLMRGILAQFPGEVLILDRMEILYTTQLEIDPLRMLQDLSRNRTIVAVWSGSVKGNHLTYARPGHPEFREYSLDGLRVIDLNNA
jgi:phosphoribosylpyrophosphate synthetase